MSATDEKKGPSPQKKRGRPRAFEPDAVLPQAMETFLRYGYAGASLEALTTSMGVNKPSLYATFGDKRALFRRVVDARVKELGRRYRRAFDRGDSVESSLRAVFEEAVVINVNAGGAPGCLIGSAAAGEAVVDESLARFSREYFALCDRELGAWFDEAYGACGPIRGAALGRLVSGIIHDIAIRARIGEPKAKLREYARDAALALSRAAGGVGSKRS